MNLDAFPDLPYDEWEETKVKLHLISQMAGKVRLKLMPEVNHWWHAPLYVSARGLTTGLIPVGRSGAGFEVELDLVDNMAAIRSSDGQSRSVPMEECSIAEFYTDFFGALAALGVDVKIVPAPFDPDRVGSDIPFDEDDEHRAYDPEFARRYQHALIGIDSIFREFRGRFIGKCSPVHVFWHSFDIAVTRFSGRRAPVSPDADPVTKAAYSHENISAGFWAGDSNFREPAFYSYTHPEPDGLAGEPLKPGEAWWQEQNGTHMAMLRYDDMRRADDPRATLLDFMQSAYEAGAKRAGWPREELEA